MDEFQEVASFNGSLFKLLKKELDENVNTRYLFSGSSIRMLASIFLSEDAPLYLMASRHQIQSLEEATVSRFVTQRLAVAGLHTSPEAASLFHSLTGGIPFYVQKLGFLAAQHAQSAKLKKMTSDVVQIAYSAMLQELGSEFEARWVNRLTHLQRQIVRAIAQLGDGSVSEIAQQMGVNRTDISSTLRRLRDTMVVTANEDSGYALTDVVFGAWLHQV